MYLIEQNSGMSLQGTQQVLLGVISDPSPVVRRSALAALGRLGDPSLVPVFVGCLADQGRDDESWWEDDSRWRTLRPRHYEHSGRPRRAKRLETIVKRVPNPRVQRPRPCASLRGSPLTRHPLGGSWQLDVLTSKR